MHTILHRIFTRLKYAHASTLSSVRNSRATYYGPIRIFDSLPDGLVDRSKIIIQVRDPRDILTSKYFSMGYSHVAPESNVEEFLEYRKRVQEMDINEFVLQNVGPFKKRFRQLQTFLQHPNVLLLFYEQMVTQFDLWFDQIIKFCGLQWNWKLRRCLNGIRAEADFSVSEEDVMRHKRQVQPGDYLRKLRPETIDELTLEFADALNVFYGSCTYNINRKVA